MRLRWPIRMLLCACAFAPASVRAQTNPAAQAPETAPGAAARPHRRRRLRRTRHRSRPPPNQRRPPARAGATSAPRREAAQPGAEGTQAAPPHDAARHRADPKPHRRRGQPPVPATEGASNRNRASETRNRRLPWSATLIWRQGYVVAGSRSRKRPELQPDLYVDLPRARSATASTKTTSLSCSSRRRSS